MPNQISVFSLDRFFKGKVDIRAINAYIQLHICKNWS
jgi:hypothetical protein